MANFVNVIISGNAGPLKKALNGATANMSTFQKTVATGFIVAGAAATAFAASAIKAAAKDQVAMQNLERQIRASTGATHEQIKAAEKYLKTAGRASAFGRTALIPGYQSLVVATKDVTKAQAIMNVAIDTARARNLDVSTTAEALAKGYAGNTRALRSLSPELKKAIADGATFSDVLKILNKNFGGAGAEYAKTFNGRLQILNNTTAALKKQIGAGLLPIVEKLIPVFQTVADVMAGNPKIVLALTIGIGALSAVFITATVATAAYTTAVKVAGIATRLFATEVATAEAATGLIVFTLGAAAAAYFIFGKDIKKASDNTNKFSEALFTSGEAQKEALKTLITSSRAWSNMAVVFEKSGYSASVFTDFIKGAASPLDDFALGLAQSIAAGKDFTWWAMNGAHFKIPLRDAKIYKKELEALLKAQQQYKTQQDLLAALGFDDATKAREEAAAKAAEKAADRFEAFKKTLKSAKDGIRAYAAELSSAISSTVSLATAVQQATDTNAAQSETLSTALEDRRKAYEDLDQAKATRDIEAYNKALGDVAATEARVSEAQKAKPTDYTAVFRAQIEAAKKFAGLLQQLIANGLKKPGVAQLLDLGPVAGAQVAADLLAGTAGMTVTSLNEDLAAVAAAGTAAGMAVPGAAAALTATPNKNYTITVNAGVGDKTEIGKQVVAALQQYEARFGAIPVKVKK